MSDPERAPGPTGGTGRRSRGWLFWVLVIGIPFAVLSYLGIVFGTGFLLEHAAKELPLSGGEREVLVDAGDVSEWFGDFSVELSAERLSKVRYFDRSYEISYEYDSPAGVDPLYVSCSVNLERNLTDALATYLPLWTATRIGFSVGAESEVRVDEMKDFYQWGDQSRFGVLYADGDPVGNLFVARQDKRIFYLVMVGVYFDEQPYWQDFIEPTLQRLSAYAPE